MLKFNTWPPQPGQVEFTDYVLRDVDKLEKETREARAAGRGGWHQIGRGYYGLENDGVDRSQVSKHADAIGALLLANTATDEEADEVMRELVRTLPDGDARAVFLVNWAFTRVFRTDMSDAVKGAE